MSGAAEHIGPIEPLWRGREEFLNSSRAPLVRFHTGLVLGSFSGA